MSKKALLSLHLDGLTHVKSGKVREVYSIAAKDGKDECLLFVASDRISAFDVIMPNGIPEKGKVLTQISCFWFQLFNDCMPNHLITEDVDAMIAYAPELSPHRATLEGRAMLVKKTQPLIIECIVRGYLAGSGWKEYKKQGSVCGISLPTGLQESDQLPQVIFTPSTKADSGHDENIDEETARKLVGDRIFDIVREKSIAIYSKAAAYALDRGIIICDTKFEFGVQGDDVILIDEILTPDSSRFWPKDQYVPGRSQPSFDKQFVRDYLEGLDWDKTPPGPELPEEIIEKSHEKYVQAYEALTHKSFS